MRKRPAPHIKENPTRKSNRVIWSEMEATFLLAVIAATAVTSIVCQNELEKICNAQINCRDCIRASPKCSWCKKFSNSALSSGPRCAVRSDPRNSDCSLANVENPRGNIQGLSQDDFSGLNQISPLQANISLRPNQPQEFTLEVRPSNNYPIDLYLLMDLSYSMRDDLAKLKTLGAQLSERIEGITPNFRLGFGSFVDKKLGPFSDLNPQRLEDPCYPDLCLPPYSFHHVVSLTDNNNIFAMRVDQQVISGNQDFPEGGFDGFLQSIVCKKMVGWRNVSRKLLLYLSDAGFHFSGDGLLGGVIRPHDGRCHMEDLTPDSTGNIVYQHWNVLDYPSIGQIAEKLFEFDVIPIFAVVQSIQDIYDPLVDELGRDRAFLGTLAADSSNVVDLVEELYYKISQRIVFDPEVIPGLSIKVTPLQCPGPLVDNVCTGVTINKSATFNVEATITECTEELAAGPRLVPIRVVGFGTFHILVTPLCNCSCENRREMDSDSCSGRGDLVCGICECERGYFGESCQCDSTGVDANGQIFMCPTGVQGLQCSGRGVCTCGICECRKRINGEDRFSGKACECDNSICEGGSGVVCSGPAQGECTCEGCRCLNEPTTGRPYNGTFCECSPNTQTCRDPTNSTDICNGRGWCNCGQCSCLQPYYFGTYCELCSGSSVCVQGTCDVSGPNGVCTECVVALLEVFRANNVTADQLFSEAFVQEAIGSGMLPSGSSLQVLEDGRRVILLPQSFSMECNASCSLLVITSQIEELDYEVQGFVSTRCQYRRLGCDYRYYVALNTTDGTSLPIHVEYPPYCGTQGSSGGGSDLAIPPWAIALILILLLLLLGLLALVLLKLLLMLLDWIEVRRFEKELSTTKYTKNENPLFHSPQKEYKNPLYGK